MVPWGVAGPGEAPEAFHSGLRQGDQQLAGTKEVTDLLLE